jgi:hypothetical protein
MGEYEPNDSRNVTGTAATPDGRWTGQAANDPTRQDQMQMQQSGQSVGQSNDGVSNAANQGNDHTSAIGKNQAQQFDASGQGGQGGGVGADRFADQIAKHQEVVDSAGNHVGTVDHVDGDRIKLTRKDSADGEHHYVALSQIDGIAGGRVRLSASGDMAR